MYSRISQISKYIECNGEPWFSLLEKGVTNVEENTSMYHIILDWNLKYQYEYIYTY